MQWYIATTHTASQHLLPRGGLVQNTPVPLPTGTETFFDRYLLFALLSTSSSIALTTSLSSYPRVERLSIDFGFQSILSAPQLLRFDNLFAPTGA